MVREEKEDEMDYRDYRAWKEIPAYLDAKEIQDLVDHQDLMVAM